MIINYRYYEKCGIDLWPSVPALNSIYLFVECLTMSFTPITNDNWALQCLCICFVIRYQCQFNGIITIDFISQQQWINLFIGIVEFIK